MIDSLLDDMTAGCSALIVSATGDAPPHWSAPASLATRRLTLDLSAKRHRGFWAMQLDNAVRDAAGPLLLVAEGFACLAIVRWAQLSPRRYVENIAGALLFAPLSLELEQGPMLRDMYPSPAMPLPFRSAVIEAHTSPLIARVLDLADVWGSTLVDVTQVPERWHADAAVPIGQPALAIVAEPELWLR